MKLKKLVLATITAGALIGGSLQSQAQQTDFHLDSDQNWLGYINVFDQADNFQFGFGEGNLATASGNFTSLNPSPTLVMSPNTRLYDENASDPFWVNQTTFEAELVSEFNMYVELFDNAYDGLTVNFGYDTIANDLPAGYEAVGFIKVLDAFNTWATTQIVTAPLVAGQGAALSLTVDGTSILAGTGTISVQYGFYVKGAYVSSFDPVSLTGATIVPEPTTFALAGLGAAALLIFRRRS